MLATAQSLENVWAALESFSMADPQSSSEWLVSLKIVMAGVERALQQQGRGAFIFLIPPSHLGEPPPQSDAGDAPDPQREGSPSQPGG